MTPRLDKQLLPLVRQQAYELQQLSSQLASLKDALEERKPIEKAKSLLMTHRGMQEEQASADAAQDGHGQKSAHG